MNSLDLRWRGRIGEELTPRFDQIAIRIRGEFIEAICKASRSNNKNMDWWMSSASSRNIFSSPLFHNTCAIILLRELLDEGKTPESCCVDSKMMAEILSKKAVEKGVQLNIEVDSPHRRFRPVLFTYLLLMSVWQLICVRLVFGKPARPSGQSSILVDTYVSPGHEMDDRYYPGMTDQMEKTERDRLWFVPTLAGYSPIKFLGALRLLRSSRQGHWIFREQYLRPSDYLHAVSWVFRVGRLQPGTAMVEGLDISGIMQEELGELRDAGAAITGLLNERFFQRLSESGVIIHSVVDWHENQVVDKGWNAGLNRHYPDVPTIGYQGYVVTPHYLVMYPSSCEMEAGLLPDVIGVTGKGYSDERVAWSPGLKVKPVPAFRFSGSYKVRLPKSSDTTSIQVVVALPKDVADADEVLNALKLSATDAGILFMIKPHPAQTRDYVSRLIHRLPSTCKMVEDTFNVLLEKADVVLSMASSVCLEALASGVPVAIIAGGRGLIHNPIPADVNKQLWSLIIEYDTLEKSLRDLASVSKPELMKEAERVRQQYFEPVTREAVYDMLAI